MKARVTPTKATNADTGADQSGVVRTHAMEFRPWLTCASRYVATQRAVAAAAPRLTSAVGRRTGSDLAICRKFGIQRSAGPEFGNEDP